MKSKIYYFIILFSVICISFYSCNEKNDHSEVKRDSISVVTEEIPFDTLTVNELCEAGLKNIIKAEADLLQKNILIKGYIESIENREGGPSVIISNIKEDNDLLDLECISMIQCLLDTSTSNMNKVKELNTGQQISLVGTVSEIKKTSNVITAVINGSVLK